MKVIHVTDLAGCVMKIRDNIRVEKSIESLQKAFTNWQASLALSPLFLPNSPPFFPSFPSADLSFPSFLFFLLSLILLLSTLSCQCLGSVSGAQRASSNTQRQRCCRFLLPMTSQRRNTRESAIQEILPRVERYPVHLINAVQLKLPYCLKMLSFFYACNIKPHRFNIPSFIYLFLQKAY